MGLLELNKMKIKIFDNFKALETAGVNNSTVTLSKFTDALEIKLYSSNVIEFELGRVFKIIATPSSDNKEIALLTYKEENVDGNLKWIKVDDFTITIKFTSITIAKRPSAFGEASVIDIHNIHQVYILSIADYIGYAKD